MVSYTLSVLGSDCLPDRNVRSALGSARSLLGHPTICHVYLLDNIMMSKTSRIPTAMGGVTLDQSLVRCNSPKLCCSGGAVPVGPIPWQRGDDGMTSFVQGSVALALSIAGNRQSMMRLRLGREARIAIGAVEIDDLPSALRSARSGQTAWGRNSSGAMSFHPACTVATRRGIIANLNFLIPAQPGK